MRDHLREQAELPELATRTSQPVGKATLTQRHAGRTDAAASARLDAAWTTPVQLQVDEHSGLDDDGVHAAAAHGVAGPGERLPHLEQIQRSFGRHDVGGVTAHFGTRASEANAALGAHAYATGDHVVFGAGTPSVFLAAHEAAHVVQQRAGVHLSSAVGRSGDSHEQHADAVAERVVRGESAVDLLDQVSGGGAATAREAVQRQETPKVRAVPIRDATQADYAKAKGEIPAYDWQGLPVPFDLAAHATRKLPYMVQPTAEQRFDANDAQVAEAARAAGDTSEQPPVETEPAHAKDDKAGHAAAWTQIALDAAQIYGAWNTGVGEFKAFKGSLDDATFHELEVAESWSKPKGFGGSVEDLAEAQGLKTGLGNGATTTVGEAASAATSGSERSTLESAAIEEKGGVAPVQKIYGEVKAAESDLAKTIDLVQAHAYDLRTAIANRRGVVLNRKLMAATSEKEDAVARQAALQSSKDAWSSAIVTGLGALEIVFGAFKASGAAGKVNDDGIMEIPDDTLVGSGKGLAGEHKDSIVAAVADIVVSPFFYTQLSAAAEGVRKAEKEIEKLTGAIQESKESAATSDVYAKIQYLLAAKTDVVRARQVRRTKYSELAAAIRGTKAAKRDPKGAGKLSAMVAAIPVVKTMVGKLEAIDAKMRLPKFTHLSGQGYYLWTQSCITHQSSDYTELPELHGMVWYAMDDLQTSRRIWRGRLENLEQVLALLNPTAF